MGCACAREHSFDKGNYSIYSIDSPGKLVIEVMLYDPKARPLWTNQKFSNENFLLIEDKEVKRSEKQAKILEDGFLFTFNEIDFDEARLDKLFAPITFDLTFNQVYMGSVTLNNLKSGLFNHSRETIVLKDLDDNKVTCDVLYSVVGKYFLDLRTLALKHLPLDEQLVILHKIIIARNNEDNLTNQAKTQIREFLGDKETNVRVKIFEKLVELPGEKSCVVIKEFLKYFNPYQITLTISFKNFIKNVVAKDEGLEEFARNLIEINKEDYLIYENKESVLLMLKAAFYKGEDSKGYFRTLAKNSVGTTEKVKEMLEIPGVFENVFVEAFKNDHDKAVRVCNFMMVFIGMEEFLKKNWENLRPLLKFNEEDKNKDKCVDQFIEFAIKMGKK